MEAGVRLSLATIYNTLNQFAEAGLLCKVCVNGGRTYFDTDSGNHQHFYVEAESRLIDVPAGQIQFGMLPEPPEGYSIAKVDVVIQLVRNKSENGSAPAIPVIPIEIDSPLQFRVRTGAARSRAARHTPIDSTEFTTPLATTPTQGRRSARRSGPSAQPREHGTGARP